MTPVVCGNSVLLPIHKAGNAITCALFINQQIAKWEKENPDKKIVKRDPPEEVSATRSRAAFVRSVSFTWDFNPRFVTNNPIIKHHVVNSNKSISVALYTDDYGRGINKILALVNTAKRDFPELINEDILVQIYGGNSHKHQIAIEFDRPEGTVIPVGYTQVITLEPTL